MQEFTFSFLATKFSGLNHQDEPRQEEIKISATNFEEAIEVLLKRLNEFRNWNSFRMFTVYTPDGWYEVITNPSTLFNIYWSLGEAKLTLGKQLAASRI